MAKKATRSGSTAPKDQAFNAGPNQKGKYPKGGEPTKAAKKQHAGEEVKPSDGPMTKLAEPGPAEPTEGDEDRQLRRANFGY
jgi:hypothetical protein